MKFKFALPIHQRTLRVISLLKVFNSASSFERGRKKKFERGRKEEKIYEKMNYYHAIKLHVLTFLIPIPFTVSASFLNTYLQPLSDVSSVEPSVFIQSLLRLRLVSVVTQEHIGSFDTHLSYQINIKSREFLKFVVY